MPDTNFTLDLFTCLYCDSLGVLYPRHCNPDIVVGCERIAVSGGVDRFSTRSYSGKMGQSRVKKERGIDRE